MKKFAMIIRRAWFHSTSIRLGITTGTLGLMYPQFALADGLGATIKKATTEISTGGTAAVKIGSAFVGVAMVAYSVYGLGWGRKKDEREYPMGQTLIIGITGAVFLSLLAYAGILNETFFQSDMSGDGISLVDE